MKKYNNWYDFTEGEHIKVRLPRIMNGTKKLEFYVPCRPSGLWREEEHFYALFVDSKIQTSKVIKFGLNGYPQNEITIHFHDLVSKWKLTKSVDKFSVRDIFDMTLNQVNKEGELVRCV